MKLTIKKHCVEECSDDNPVLSGLSPLQKELLINAAKIRIAHAPTGAGKSYAFQQLLKDKTDKKRILFIVPTRRLAQNIANGIKRDLKGIEKTLRVWTSDQTEQLKEENKKAHIERLKEVDLIDGSRLQGEIIITVPEVISQLILRRRLEKDQNDKSIFNLLYSFHHIVFDEFHTIDERGFGLAGTFAKLISMQEYDNHAQLSFLSATPLDISKVLINLGIPTGHFTVLKDKLTEKGRVIHGDVCLEFNESSNMVDTLRLHIDKILKEINNNRQVVIIYNSLADLKHDCEEKIPALFAQYNIKIEDCLSINSLDDSKKSTNIKGQLAVGRMQDPSKFKILIATSSVEMGVTFEANLLFMESGFKPMNFLQRYGRAARGDHTGHVIVNWNKESTQYLYWFQQLLAWVNTKNEQYCEITELSQQLSQGLNEQFAPPNLEDCLDAENEEIEEGNIVFGVLGNRAIYITGLYWYVLLNNSLISKSKEHRKIISTFKEGFPEQSPPKSFLNITKYLKKLKEAQKDPECQIIAKACNKWHDLFIEQVKILRDIEPKITVNANNVQQEISYSWLERETSILDYAYASQDTEGTIILNVPNDFNTYLLEKRQYVAKRKTVYFPHSHHSIVLEDRGMIGLMRDWVNEFYENDIYDLSEHKGMQAARRLVLCTGIIPSDYEPLDSN